MSASYRPTIGLEVHAELKTETKMFCRSKNAPEGSEPNAHTCPVCLAHPGTLPVINRKAVEHVLRVGTALGSTIASYTEFDRKSYFYPDIPKGYQISQYQYPLVSGGALNNVAITRVHLEEDTARSTHAGGESLVDFNRAGVPLMELVTEPVIHDAETAGAFARELQLLLRTLGVSDANLEKGEMRVEANVSVSKTNTPSTDYVEVKNINSFRSVERAIAYEIERQTALLEKGERVVKATRGWDEHKQETFHQRFKEGSADYRYFPEPDLPKLILSEVPEFQSEVLTASMPELPWERRARYGALGLKSDDVEILLQDIFLNSLFEGVAEHANGDADVIRLSGNYLISDVVRLIRDIEVQGSTDNLSTDHFFALMQMVQENKVSSRGAKELLSLMYTEGGDPEVLARDKGLLQVSDTESLRKAVREVLEAHSAVAEEYRAGKESVLQFLVGQGMKATKGAGNPGVIKDLLVDELTT